MPEDEERAWQYWRVTLGENRDVTWVEAFLARKSWADIVAYFTDLDFKVLTWVGDAENGRAQRICFPNRALVMEIGPATKEEYDAD